MLAAKEYANDIAKFLKDNDTDVRYFAVRSLGDICEKKYAKDIAKLLKDADAQVRVEAINALDRIDAKEYANDIVELLEDDDKVSVYNKEKEIFDYTTISSVAERVLKEWGVDVEKLKEKNKK